MEKYREVLEKYNGLYEGYLKGNPVSLTITQKIELADIREEKFNQRTNVGCSTCVEEMFKLLMSSYVKFKEIKTEVIKPLNDNFVNHKKKKRK